jgi:hypothetical protein
VEYANSEDLSEKISGILDDLLDGDVGLDEIGIVLPNESAKGVLSFLPSRLQKKILPLDVNTVRMNLKNRLVWGTAEQFKGLERPVMFAIGFDRPEFLGARLSEFYVAVTRGNYSLSVFVSRRFRELLSGIEQRNRDVKLEGST